MTSPSEAADAYLSVRFNVGLEQVLLDVIDGYPSTAMAAVTDIASDRFDTRRHADGGVSEGYAGQLTIQGVAYAWRAWVYRDGDGCRFLSDLSEFVPIDWQAGIRIAAAAG